MNAIKGLVKKLIFLTKKERVVPIIELVPVDSTFKNKVVLITGGSGGIGMSIAKCIIQCGGKVVITGTNQEKLKKCCDMLGDNAAGIIIDMNDVDTFYRKIYDAASIFGSLDALVCSAGVHTENVKFWEINPCEYSRVVDINLKGTYFICFEFAKYLRNASKKGHILIVSSSRGSEPAWSPYGVSKWGLKGITEGFAKMLLPYGITVNSIAPGTTATELIGFKEGDSLQTFENNAQRLILPEELSPMISYLLSDAGNMITGETIHISAGRGIFDVR